MFMILVTLQMSWVGCAANQSQSTSPDSRLNLPTVQLMTSTDGQESMRATYLADHSNILVSIQNHPQLSPAGVSDDEITLWIKHNADMLTRFLGSFPVQKINVIVQRQSRGRIGGGSTNPLRINIRVGQSTTSKDLNNDWIMLHEMFHLAFPDTRDELVWLNEGMASYFEPIARAREGNLTLQQVWSEFARGMSQGLPDPHDQGLNRTHTWGRVYWGGALFCLQADVEIRRQTQNKHSLDDVLRAIVRQGGSNQTHWPIARILNVGDQATGTKVLSTLYREQALAPGKVDLPKLWSQLGIKYIRTRNGDQVVFDDNAPLADVRQAITSQSQ